MILFSRSRGARLLLPSVQSLYRKALAPTTSVRASPCRLYASLQKPPDSVKDNDSKPFRATGGPGAKDGSISPDKKLLLAKEFMVFLGYPENQNMRFVAETGDKIKDAEAELSAARKAEHRYRRFAFGIIGKKDLNLATRILHKELGAPIGGSLHIPVPETPSNYTKKNAMIVKLVHHLGAKRPEGNPTEVKALRKELGRVPSQRALARHGRPIPFRVHDSIKAWWKWLLLKVAAEKKSSRRKVSADLHPPSLESPPQAPDAGELQRLAGEVQRLTDALGVLKDAMVGGQIDGNTTITDKTRKKRRKGGKDKASNTDSTQTVTPDQAQAKPAADDQSKAQKTKVSPTEVLGNLTAKERAAFQELHGSSAKEGPSDTPPPKVHLRKVRTGGKMRPYSIHYVKAKDLKLQPIEKPQPPVPGVEYGLDRVLFNPGVYHLQCPRTKVYNFDPYLAKIMPIEEFDFKALKQYVTSSKDQTLIQMASSLGKKYTGSTSSMTTSLAHFHYLISSWRPITTKSLTNETPVSSFNFTRTLRAPAAAFLHYKDGTYAIDADKEFDRSTILSMLGKSMEKLLTLPKKEFKKYHRDRSHLLSDSAREDPEAFHYTTLGDFLMRSQLDAHNPRLPGTGMYDLKTRAVLSIRMESDNIKNGLGYEIRKRFGEYESFEREYLDMIRSAFLKYSMQVRMGRMDGIFVAYHNTERVFGFQYVPLEEMDYTIHGSSDRKLGDDEFKLSVTLLNKVLDRATAKFPGQSLRLHFETRPSETPFMYIFAKPVSPSEIQEVQEANKDAVEKFEQEMMNPTPELEAEPTKEDARTVEDLDIVNEDEEDTALDNAEEMDQEMWDDMMARVEDAMEDDARGFATVREAIERALEESGLLVHLSPEKSKAQVDVVLSAITSSDLRAAAEDIQTAGTMEEGVIGPDDGAEIVEEAEANETENCDKTGTEPVKTDDNKDIAIGSAAESLKTSTENTSELKSDDESIAIESDAETAVEESSATVKDTAEMSLKDMILGLAAHAQMSTTASEPSSPGHAGDNLTPRDTRRIKKFEKILSEMLSGSKEPSDNEAAPADVEAKLKAADVISNKKSPETSSTADSDGSIDSELLGMVLTARNMVAGQFVERVDNPEENWSVAYSIEEMTACNADRIYKQVKARRSALFHTATRPSSSPAQQAHRTDFFSKLRKISATGRQYRKSQNKLEKKNPIYVFGRDAGLKYSKVFGKTHKKPKKPKKGGDHSAGVETEKSRPAEDGDDVNRVVVDGQ